MRRRRFLVAAACAALLAGDRRAPRRVIWRGTALGADASIVLDAADPAEAEAALAAVRAVIAEAEALFSLYRPDSALSRLNAEGALADPSPGFAALLAESRAVSAATEGFFDPTIQPLWRALAAGEDAADARRLVDWRGLGGDAAGLRFARPGMAASFNGIAQGWAADRAAEALRAHGFARALVNTGEIVGLGARAGWRVGAPHPSGGLAATFELAGRAAATSAPRATLVGPDGAPHVFDPVGAPGPRAAQVTVVAETAARADALATAIAAAPIGEAERLLRAGGGEEAAIVAEGGAVLRLRA